MKRQAREGQPSQRAVLLLLLLPPHNLDGTQRIPVFSRKLDPASAQAHDDGVQLDVSLGEWASIIS